MREAEQQNQVHKGKEQFWSLLLVAVNILVTSIITVVIMEVEDDTLGILECQIHLDTLGKTEAFRWWFKNLDRVQYIIGHSCISSKYDVVFTVIASRRQ